MSSTQRDELLNRDELRALYESTGGANWKNNDNWTTGAHVSRWHGITVNQNGVARLELGANNLVGRLEG